MKRASRLLMAIALGLCISMPVLADNNESEPDLAAIRIQQTELRANVKAGDDIFDEMSESKRQDLLSRQDKVLQLLEGLQTFDQLNERDQLALFNDLEWINGAVNDSMDERLICRSRTVTGSHRSQRFCKTAAQREREREESIRKLEKEFQGGFCPPGGSCAGG